jgi:ankyrin repeat protein
MSSAIFKPEILKERTKAEVKTDTEEEFIATIKSIIEKGEDINAERDHNKETLLHLAAKKGYTKAVKLLIDNHANINAREFMELTPLHLAVIEGKTETVTLLIANGADLNAMSCYLSTPLWNAAGGGKVEITKLLLEKGADVNAKTKEGYTPLQAALTSLKYERFMKDYNTTPDKQNKIIEMLRAYGGKE